MTPDTCPVVARIVADLAQYESKFRVGDRVQGSKDNMPQATVTEWTWRGFKWRFDAPYSLGSRHGTILTGEAYGVDYHVLISRPAEVNNNES